MSDNRVLPVRAYSGVITYKILVGGAELPMTNELYAVISHKELNRVPYARLIFRDGDPALETFPLSESGNLDPGKEVEIQLGYDSNDKTVFKGIIVKQGIRFSEQGNAMLEVECRDKSVKLTVGRKNKQFEDVKDSEASEQLISGAGLTADVEATTVKHKELIQFNSTDWDFILSRAEANGKVVMVSDGKVSVKKPVFSGSEALSLLYGDTLYEFEAEMDARHQVQGVKSYGWDPANQAVVTEDGSPPSANPMGSITESTLANTIGLSAFELKHGGAINQGELKAWADGQLLKNYLAKVTGRAKLRGLAEVLPGQLVKLDGLGSRFNGKAYITAVRHEIGEGEWYTHLQFGRLPTWFHQEFETMDSPASGLLPGVHGLQIGIVAALEGDPDGEFRIHVKLPLLDSNHPGTWARLASLDAGKDRGWVIRPEIGDEVVVGFLQDDPRHPVVLGMLHSSKNASPIPPKDDNHEKGYTSRSKMRLHFDDDKKILTIETPAGKKVILDEDAKNITIKDENNNKIVMDKDGILIQSSKDIVLKATADVKVEGVNIEQKAQAQFKAQGSAGLEVSSSAVATVKGSLVKIN